MPLMNEQGARIAASGDLGAKTIAGTFCRPTRRLLMAYRFYKAKCQEAINQGRTPEIGDELIALDKLVTELERRGKKLVRVLS